MNDIFINRAVVVIPIYKEVLTLIEMLSLNRCRKILGPSWPIIFIAPTGKDFSYVQKNEKIIKFPAEHFSSIQNYSKLMLTTAFYKAFIDFEYILIHQLDAFVFYDALEFFCNLNYDYIGAPWPIAFNLPINHRYLRVGNGGFSLRKTQACFNLINKYQLMIEEYKKNNVNEDVFFSHCGILTDFNVAPINIAYKFSMEFMPKRCIKKNNYKLPFGCHQFAYDAKFYNNLLASIENINLSLRTPIENNSLTTMEQWLTMVALGRLNRRINNKELISSFLTQFKFDTIHILINNNTLLLYNLLKEQITFKKVFKYNDNNWSLLLNRLKDGELHLILIELDDKYIENIEKRGFKYGIHFVSYIREYLNYCEKLFHNLGK